MIIIISNNIILGRPCGKKNIALNILFSFIVQQAEVEIIFDFSTPQGGWVGGTPNFYLVIQQQRTNNYLSLPKLMV